MKHIRSSNIKDLTDVYLESLLQDLPSEDKIADKQVLSEQFLNRMNRLIRSTHQPANAWKKTLLIAVIICTILLAAVSVYAYREAITGFIINICNEFTLVVFSNQSDTLYSGADNDLTENLPAIIPHGYKVSELLEQTNSVLIIYSNEAGMELLLTKTRKSGLQISIDTEGVNIEEIYIDSHKGLFYTNKGQNNLVWEDEKYAYIITGELSKQEMIDLAISTKFAKSEIKRKKVSQLRHLIRYRSRQIYIE